MLDTIKKSLMAGVGLALKSKQEITELAKEFAEKGKMNQEEGRKLLDELLEKYDEAKEKFDKRIEESVRKVLKKADLARHSDIEALKAQIEDIKKLISKKKG